MSSSLVHILAACVRRTIPLVQISPLNWTRVVCHSEPTQGAAGLALRAESARPLKHTHKRAHTRRCCSLDVNKLATDPKRALHRWWISLLFSSRSNQSEGVFFVVFFFNLF